MSPLIRPIFIAAIILAQAAAGFSQEIPDSVKILDPYTVQGYLYDRSISEVPASLTVLSESQLDRFNNVSILPVINTVPGVRMEERSPGSYRFSIRGSSIRSPFGVRNVKVYYNNLPFTDAGGNTYLNLLDFSSTRRVEIIKGPGGSLYGAGTGGIVLLSSGPVKKTGTQLSSTFGSYGLFRLQLQADVVSDRASATIGYGRTRSDGYRAQSELVRDVFNLELNFSLAASTSVLANVLYADVFYETPGALTLQQFNDDPRQARPSGMFRGAEEQNAHVKNKTAFGGLTLNQQWTPRLVSNLGLYFSKTDFVNFAIANYEERDETNAGFRLENSYAFGGDAIKGKISLGAEFQSMSSPVDVYENNSGIVGPLTIADDLSTDQLIIFSQLEIDFPHEFFLTVGAGESWLKYDFLRNYPQDDKQERKFAAEFSPRAALLKKIGKISVYTSVSKGFSPPTLAEVRPSTNEFNGMLKPESGTNFEVGARGGFSKFTFDLTTYSFNLNETIALRRGPLGQEFFVNSGRTDQRGAELSVAWKPSTKLAAWGSFAYNNYRFKEHQDFSGNELTGVPEKTATLGLDFQTKPGFYCMTTYSYTDAIPLNDANEAYAADYFLLGTRVGFRRMYERSGMDVFVAVDNALDEKYSLGNDLNANGGRFYNAAPRRNYSVGVKLQLFKK
jgi:iron complex outermembrane recepter protein